MGGPSGAASSWRRRYAWPPAGAAARLRELERRNLELAAEAAAKDSRIAELAGKAEDMDARIAELELLRAQEAEQAARLQARVHELVRELFGSKTEKHPPTKAKPKPKPPKKPEPPPADEPEPPPADEPKRKRGRQPGAPTPPRIDRKHLPGQRLRLLPSERCCPTCGEPYVSNGTEKSELIEIVFEVLRRELARQRLRPRCTCPEASAPVARLMQRTQLGVSAWTYLFVQVFALYRPQAAVVRDLTARGLRIGGGTVSQGLRRIGELFEPVLEAIVERQQEAAWAHADETSWPRAGRGGRPRAAALLAVDLPDGGRGAPEGAADAQRGVGAGAARGAGAERQGQGGVRPLHGLQGAGAGAAGAGAELVLGASAAGLRAH